MRNPPTCVNFNIVPQEGGGGANTLKAILILFQFPEAARTRQKKPLSGYWHPTPHSNPDCLKEMFSRTAANIF